MADLDHFDPTRALDGWRVPAPPPLDLELKLDALRPVDHAALDAINAALAVTAPSAAAFDSVHALDGWRPPTPAPLDLELKSLRSAGTRPDGAKKAWLKARGYEMLDVEDIELCDKPPPRARVEAPVPPMDDAGALDEAAVLPTTAEALVVEAPVAQSLDDHAGQPDPPLVGPAVPADFATAEAPPLPTTAEALVLEVEVAAPTEPDPQPVIVEALFAEVALPEPAAWTVGEDLAAPDQPSPAAAAEAERPEMPNVPVVPDPIEAAGVPPSPATVEAPALDVPGESPAVPDAALVRPDEDSVAELPVPEAEALAFRAPPPAEPDARRVLEDIRLPNVEPPPLVVEPPALDFHVAAPAAAPNPQGVIESIELPKVAHPVAFEAPVLDVRSLHQTAPRANRDPRLLSRWQPLAWTALARRVRGATTEVVQTPSGPLVETHMPQWLCALWRPQSVDAPLLGRWPELAGLVSADTAFGALHQLLAELPPRAQIWSAELEADWSLVAELVLRQDAGLRPVHAQALRELIEAERDASHAQVNGRYAAKGGVVRRRA
ncbi:MULTISPECIES: hypothetical protein [unclassified Roseateles]|uniref:hypothetical protein n=1 Tax=unclassified Roseateles TaxID=2626991 RepID=UPI00071272A2|nr:MULTISPECIES: hypothetical protein [unclassified Roseateles]KQW46524.1 hypothetical protein ASC81_08980 [Pelomonas sp. Root405]KRA73575.1 hypothetical protein ASD88_08980 [Pelomonas sp. Root662]